MSYIHAQACGKATREGKFHLAILVFGQQDAACALGSQCHKTCTCYSALANATNECGLSTPMQEIYAVQFMPNAPAHYGTVHPMRQRPVTYSHSESQRFHEIQFTPHTKKFRSP